MLSQAPLHPVHGALISDAGVSTCCFEAEEESHERQIHAI